MNTLPMLRQAALLIGCRCLGWWDSWEGRTPSLCCNPRVYEFRSATSNGRICCTCNLGLCIDIADQKSLACLATETLPCCLARDAVRFPVPHVRVRWRLLLVAGEGLSFTIKGAKCTNATKIERATAEESKDADFSYCTLPAPVDDEDYRTTPCTQLSSGLKIDGVAMYYDDRCNYADYSGCGGRSIAACRLCFVDKDLWMQRFPTKRVPDWEMCPCCVADMLHMVCASTSGDGGTKKSVIIGVVVGLVGLVAVACCLSCAFGTTIVRFVSTPLFKVDHWFSGGSQEA